MKILVTGGAGFIGSAVVRLAVRRGHEVVNLDALTYAANPENVASVSNSPLYHFEQADIRDREALDRVLDQHKPDAIMHLAAESHVDRSIDGPGDFVETNITGAYNMLEAARALQQRGASAVLVKGGHMPGNTLSDVLLLADGSKHVFTDARIDTRNTHGTGCTLSAAIAAHLALGADMLRAVQRGRDYVRNALTAGAKACIGHGHGPVNHGFDPQPMHTRPLSGVAAHE